MLEHLDEPTGVDLITGYMPYLRDGATVVIITPQERGQRSDATHVRFMDDAALTALAEQVRAGRSTGSRRSRCRASSDDGSSTTRP